MKPLNAKEFNRLDQYWHEWINKQNEGEERDHSQYEWKTAIQEMRRLPYWLRKARTNQLPSEHQQCSHSPTVPIEENRLVCALGKNVKECPILQSLYAHFEKAAERDADFLEKRGVNNLMDVADHAAGYTCAWHIFTEQYKAHQEGQFRCDTSEGYVQDEGDRMYWDGVYRNLTQ